MVTIVYLPKQQNQLLSHPRAIQTSEELLLLIQIFESQGRHTEIVKILDSANLGIASRIVQNDWSMIRAKLLSLEEAKLWNEGISYTKELLPLSNDQSARKSAQEHDDWAAWNILVTATRNLNAEG